MMGTSKEALDIRDTSERGVTSTHHTGGVGDRLEDRRVGRGAQPLPVGTDVEHPLDRRGERQSGRGVFLTGQGGRRMRG